MFLFSYWIVQVSFKLSLYIKTNLKNLRVGMLDMLNAGLYSRITKSFYNNFYTLADLTLSGILLNSIYLFFIFKVKNMSFLKRKANKSGADSAGCWKKRSLFEHTIAGSKWLQRENPRSSVSFFTIIYYMPHFPFASLMHACSFHNQNTDVFC